VGRPRLTAPRPPSQQQAPAPQSTITVTQRRSKNGANSKQLDTLRSLGLRRIGHTVQVKDTKQARGMLHAVRHLIEVSEESK